MISACRDCYLVIGLIFDMATKKINSEECNIISIAMLSRSFDHLTTKCSIFLLLRPIPKTFNTN